MPTQPYMPNPYADPSAAGPILLGVAIVAAFVVACWAVAWVALRVHSALAGHRNRPSAPSTHAGATEGWSPMAEVAEAEHQPAAEPAPDFDVHRWAVDVHAELNAMEDDFRADVEHIWGRFYDWLGIDARTRLELAQVAT